MNNNHNSFNGNINEYENKKINKIINEKSINIIGKTLLIIMLVFLIDFTYTLVFKSKPIITINKTKEKYSSILYDVYICGEEKIIRFKTQKYNCKTEEANNNNNQDNTLNNNIPNNNDNNSQDNNLNNNDNNTQDNNINNNITNDKNNNNNDNNTNDKIKDNTTNKNPITDNIKDNNSTIKVIDKNPNGNCAQSIEYYYEDENYKYYFTCIKSGSMYVVIDRKEYLLKYALNNNIVTMDELIQSGFKPLKQSKNTVDR